MGVIGDDQVAGAIDSDTIGRGHRSANIDGRAEEAADQRELLNGPDTLVNHVEAAGGVYRDGRWAAEAGRDIELRAAGERRSQALDHAIAGVGDEDVAVQVHAHAERRTEAGAVGGCCRGDEGSAHVRHLNDAVIAGVGDVEIADAIHCDATGALESNRTCGDRQCAAGGGGARTFEHGHFDDAVVAGIGDVDVADSVHSDPARPAEGQRAGGDGGASSGGTGGELDDGVGTTVGDVGIALSIDGDALGRGEGAGEGGLRSGIDGDGGAEADTLKRGSAECIVA